MDDQYGAGYFAEADSALYRWRTTGMVVSARERELFALLARDLPQPGRVLATAVGEGSDCVFAAEVWPEAQHLGLDLFLSNLVHCAGLQPSQWLVNGDALALPLAEESCDVVYAKDLLHHLEQPVEALAEMWRVVAPGGTLGLIEVCGLNPVSRLLARTAAHERGILRNRPETVRQWLQEATGLEPEVTMAHALPLWRVFFHYRFGCAGLQRQSWARRTVEGVERLLSRRLPRERYFYMVARVRKPGAE